MTTKTFLNELADLESGLRNLEKIRSQVKTNWEHSRVMSNIEIQKTRIEFLKIGYKLAERDFAAQRKLL